MNIKIISLIKEYSHHLQKEAIVWNSFLEADCKLNPNPNKKKTEEAFSAFFRKIIFESLGDHESVVNKMMTIYSDNNLHNLYGPKPLEDFSLETIREHQMAVDLIEGYLESNSSLDNKKTQNLLSAIQQNLKFYTTVRAYLSQYWIKGKYKYNADAHKKELVDFCLEYSQKNYTKTEVYTALENLWSVVYQEKKSKSGVLFKSACSRAGRRKNTPSFTLKEEVSRYKD